MPSAPAPRAPGVTIHPTADVAVDATVGDGTRIWSHVQVREQARIGAGCVLGRGSFVGVGVTVGDNVKVQNNASIYEGTTLEDGVFVGPHVVFTNDKVPRAINPDGSLKAATDWTLGTIVVRRGAAVGAGAVVVTGVELGRWSIVGSGAVVTSDVPEHALVVGVPARIVGWVSAVGERCATQAEARARSLDEGATG